MSNGSDNPVPLSGINMSDDNEWDGSESELVEDDDAAEYEEHHTGIKLCYMLRSSEIYSCLTHCGSYKDHRKQILKQVISIGILGFLFGGHYIFSRTFLSLALSIVSALIICGMSFMWFFELKRRAQTLTTGKYADVEIYPHGIVVNENGQEWEIALDGSLYFEEHDNMFLIYLENGRVFIIPMRCIEPDFVADVQAMIFAGTKPKKND